MTTEGIRVSWTRAETGTVFLQRQHSSGTSVSMHTYVRCRNVEEFAPFREVYSVAVAQTRGSGVGAERSSKTLVATFSTRTFVLKHAPNRPASDSRHSFPLPVLLSRIANSPSQWTAAFPLCHAPKKKKKHS